MKRLIILIAGYLLIYASPCHSQLSRFCEALPRPDPLADESSFQLPFEVGGGLKILKGRPNPFIGHFNILPTFVLIQRTLKMGVGPDVNWSDEAPRVGATIKASLDFCDYNVASFNNIPLVSFLLTLGLNMSWQGAPIYNAGISVELGRIMTLGAAYSHFNEENQNAGQGSFAFNPFFAPRGDVVKAWDPFVGASTQSLYYQNFTFQARLKASANLPKFKLKKDDKGWNSLGSKDTNALKVFLTSIDLDGNSIISDILNNARSDNSLDHLSVPEESEHSVVSAILKGFCQAVP